MSQEQSVVLEQTVKFVKDGDLKKAIIVCLEYLESNREEVKVLLKLGDLYSKIKKTDLAIFYYQEAADILIKKGEKTRALSIYETIHKMDNSNKQILQKLLSLKQNMGHPNQGELADKKEAN